MSKLMRSRRVPLVKEEPKVLHEEFGLFLDGVEEAGGALRSLRKEHGWSLSDLADEVGVDKKQLAEIEKGGQPIPYRLARRFSEIFHQPLRNFL